MRNNKLIKIKIWGRKSTQCVTEIKKKRFKTKSQNAHLSIHHISYLFKHFPKILNYRYIYIQKCLEFLDCFSASFSFSL